MVEIILAGEAQLPALVPLFDQYRVFYKQATDLATAQIFLSERISRGESVIFMAYEGKEALGFTQLYKSFSSVSMQPIYILNDLYVTHDARNKGIGERLLKQAQAYCRQKGFKGLALETATGNPAQHLYERLGWEKDSHCFHYFWKA